MERELQRSLDHNRTKGPYNRNKREQSHGMMRQRRKVGNVYEIDLGDGTHAYAREATFSSTAIYDSRTTLDMTIDEIVKLPVLFFVAVMDFAIKLGEWKIVGNRSLADAPLPEVPPKGIIDRGIFRIYFHSGEIRSATWQEIEGLEPAMIWHPERVQKRLLDHYNGLPDKWKESLGDYYSADFGAEYHSSKRVGGL